MLKIEYKFVHYEKNLSAKAKGEALHNEAYLLLDKMLGDVSITSYEIKKTEFGKPYIENNPVYFSIAHTDGLVCCAVSTSECGIDCEKIAPRDKIKEMSERYFTENEIKVIEKSGYSYEEFLRIWTCKEAIGKRLGCGLIKAKNIDSTKENCSTIIENGYIITVNI